MSATESLTYVSTGYIVPGELTLSSNEGSKYGSVIEDNFEKLSGLVKHKARGKGVPPDSIEDVAQTVLVKAWININGGTDFESDGKFLSWISTIANNASVDFHRSFRPTEQLDIVTETSLGPDKQAIVNLELERVFDAIDHLSPLRKRAIAKSISGNERLRTAERVALVRARTELKLLTDRP